MSTADQLAEPGKGTLPLGHGVDQGNSRGKTPTKYADTLKPAPSPDEENPGQQGWNRATRNPTTGELVSPPQVEGKTPKYKPQLGDNTFNRGKINRPTETEAEQRISQDTLSPKEIEQLAEILQKIVPDQATDIIEILNTETIAKEYAISMLQAMAKTSAEKSHYPKTSTNPNKLNSPDTTKLRTFGVNKFKDALTHPDTEIFIELDGNKPHITITTPGQNQRPTIKLELTGFINLVSPDWRKTKELSQLKTLDPDNPANKLMAYYLLGKLNLSDRPFNLDPENIYITQQQQPKKTQSTEQINRNASSLSTFVHIKPDSFVPHKNGNSPKSPQPETADIFDPLTANQTHTPDKNATTPNQTTETSPNPETNTPLQDSFYTPPEWSEQQRQAYWNSLTKDQKKQYLATAQDLLKTLNADTIPAWYEHNPEAKNDQNKPVPKYKQWEQFLTRATRNDSVAEKLFAAYKVNADKYQMPQVFQKEYLGYSPSIARQNWDRLTQQQRQKWWQKQAQALNANTPTPASQPQL